MSGLSSTIRSNNNTIINVTVPTGPEGSIGPTGPAGANAIGHTGPTGPTNMNSWLIDGNQGLTGTNFLGTIDDVPLLIKINNTNRARFTNKGQIETFNTQNSTYLGENAGNSGGASSLRCVGIGHNSLLSNVNGSNCVAIGNNSMENGIKVNSNVAIGNNTLRNINEASMFDGSRNVSIGDGSMENATTSKNTVAIGYRTLRPDIGGSVDNVAVGCESMSLVSGPCNENVAIGPYTLVNNQGSRNVAIGKSSMYYNELGNNNVSVGESSLFDNVDGNENFAGGWRVLNDNISGSYNVGAGSRALFSNLQSNNTAVGAYSSTSNTSGTRCCSFGSNSSYTQTTANDSCSFGYNALNKNNANFVCAFGSRSLENNNAGSNNAYGYNTLASNVSTTGNSAFGESVLVNLTGGLGGNSAFGHHSQISNVNASYCTSMGIGSLLSNVGGNNNVSVGAFSSTALSGGSFNTSCGTSAGGSCVNSSFNTFIGNFSYGNFIGVTGVNGVNIGLGHGSGLSIIDGTYHIMIGTDHGVLTGGTNCTFIGHDINAQSAGESNTCRIRNIWNTTTITGGAVPVLVSNSGQLGTVSSLREKKTEIELMEDTSDLIEKFEVCTFLYKCHCFSDCRDECCCEDLKEGETCEHGCKCLDDENRTCGLIAEDVEELEPRLCAYDVDGKLSTIQYNLIPMYNLRALQTQIKKNKIMENELNDYKMRLSKLEEIISKLNI